MENDSTKIDSIVRENLTKIKALIERLTAEYKNNLIDPICLDEMRKILKVNSLNLTIIFTYIYEIIFINKIFIFINLLSLMIIRF